MLHARGAKTGDFSSDPVLTGSIPGENAPTGPPQIGKEMMTGWDGNENDALTGG